MRWSLPLPNGQGGKVADVVHLWERGCVDGVRRVEVLEVGFRMGRKGGRGSRAGESADTGLSSQGMVCYC